MIDFAKLLNQPKVPHGPVPGVIVGCTGHRPDKLPDAQTGYVWDNPLRCWLRDRAREEVAQILATQHPERDDFERGVLGRWLERVEWSAKYAGEAWRSLPALFVTGGAIGFDQDFAGVVHRMGHPYIVAAPFEGQERRWPQTSQAVYRQMLDHAAGVIRVSKPPTDQQAMLAAMGERNEWIVGVSDYLVAAYDGSKGGTRDTVYRWDRLYFGKNLRRIDPGNFRSA